MFWDKLSGKFWGKSVCQFNWPPAACLLVPPSLPHPPLTPLPTSCPSARLPRFPSHSSSSLSLSHTLSLLDHATTLKSIVSYHCPPSVLQLHHDFLQLTIKKLSRYHSLEIHTWRSPEKSEESPENASFTDRWWRNRVPIQLKIISPEFQLEKSRVACRFLKLRNWIPSNFSSQKRIESGPRLTKFLPNS